MSLEGFITAKPVCKKITIPYENCTTHQIPFEIKDKISTQKPYIETVCNTVEYLSDTYYLEKGVPKNRWMNNGAGYMLTSLKDLKSVDSRIYNYEKIHGIFTIKFRVWDKEKLIHEITESYTVKPDSYIDFSYSLENVKNHIKNTEHAKNSDLLFNALLIKPEKKQCNEITKHYIIPEQRTIKKYDLQEKCETEYKEEEICS
jgi:hypothetical protein